MARRPWTVDEQKKLDDLRQAGKTAPEIAAALQRTPTSIYSQLQRDIKPTKAGRRVVQLGLKPKPMITRSTTGKIVVAQQIWTPV
jgi:IS30 family transposase